MQKASKASANKPAIEMQFFQLGIVSLEIADFPPVVTFEASDSSYIVPLTFSSRILTTLKGRRQSCFVLTIWKT